MVRMQRLLATVAIAITVGLPTGVALAVNRTGGSGNDRIVGTNGNDRLRGRDGNDELIGKGGRDLLAGDAGRDRLAGGPGADTLLGGAGRDRSGAGGGRDGVAAGAGPDVVRVGGGGADQVSCGPGNDSVFADGSDSIGSDCEHVARGRFTATATRSFSLSTTPPRSAGAWPTGSSSRASTWFPLRAGAQHWPRSRRSSRR